MPVLRRRGILMERQPVVSGPIKSIGYFYDGVTELGVLEIEMTSLAIYQYKNVPYAEYTQFMGAESKGGFYASRIRGTYPSNREHFAECAKHSLFPPVHGESSSITMHDIIPVCHSYFHSTT